MKKDFYLNNIAPVFNFLGWQATTQTIPWPPQDESPGTVEITRVENKAGETVDALVVAKLCEALGAAVETPPNLGPQPEVRARTSALCRKAAVV